MSVEVKRDETSGRLRIEVPYPTEGMSGPIASTKLVTDRPIGMYPEDATPDGSIYVFGPGAWACPTEKYTPEGARAYAEALIAAADEVER